MRTPIIRAGLVLTAALAGCAGPIIKAAGSGDTAAVARMLDRGEDRDYTTSWSTWGFPCPGSYDGSSYASTPLEAAAAAGHLETVRLLLDRGSRQIPSRWSGNTPLIAAAACGRLDVMILLLERKADINAKNKDGHTALWHAVFKGDLKGAQFLLERGAESGGSYSYCRRNAVGGFASGHGTLAEMAQDMRRCTDDKPALASAEADMVRLLGNAPPADAVREAGTSAQPPTPRAPSSAVPVPAAPGQAQPGVDEPSYRSPARPVDFAVVVGIEKYSKLPGAPFADADAGAVRRHLEAMGLPARNIVGLRDADATRSAILGYLDEWLPKNVKPDSTVFFYYSGHGAPDPATGEAYLVPWDGNASFLKSTAIPIKELYSSLGRLKVKGTIVALDACFSGAGGRSVLAAGARPLVASTLKGPSPGENMTVLSAASADEITGTLDEAGHGLFTYFLLRGLSGEAGSKDGRVTARSLYEYLKPVVQDEASRQNRQQTPVLLLPFGADPVLR